MINKDYKFKGWDWSELSECFGLGTEDDGLDCDKEALDSFLLVYFNKIIMGEDPEEVKLVLDKCREYLTILSEYEHDYYAPFWKGLLAVENDELFLNLYMDLLSRMWT